METFLKKLNDYRIAVIALLGLAPGVGEVLSGIDLTSGLAVAVSEVALAVAALITVINNRPSSGKSE